MKATKTVEPTPPVRLITLPPEARLNIYKFIDPHCNLPSDYAGLLRACRQLRSEFQHEFLHEIRRHYAQELPNLQLGGCLKIRPRFPLVMADASTLDVRIILYTWYPGYYTHTAHPSCFSWPWLKTLIITFDLREFENIPPHVATCTLAHTQCLSVRKVIDKDSELTLRSEVDTVIFRWSHVPPNTVMTRIEHTWYSMLREPYMQLTRGRGHEWCESIAFNTRGGITQMAYRRRSRGMKIIMRCLADLLMGLEVWLPKLKNLAVGLGGIFGFIFTIVCFWALIFVSFLSSIRIE